MWGGRPSTGKRSHRHERLTSATVARSAERRSGRLQSRHIEHSNLRSSPHDRPEPTPAQVATRTGCYKNSTTPCDHPTASGNRGLVIVG